MATDTSTPLYQAYSVIKREGQEDWWCNIGAAFPHADGKGMNLMLQALPLDGKVVMRPPKSESDTRDDRREAEEPRSRSGGSDRSRSTRR